MYSRNGCSSGSKEQVYSLRGPEEKYQVNSLRCSVDLKASVPVGV